jgi:hypothetical protein
VGFSQGHRLLGRANRPDIGAPGPRLGQRARLALRGVDRHAQHVAKGRQNGRAALRQGDDGGEVFLRADADRAAGAVNHLDDGGQNGAQAQLGEAALMPAADIHDVERAGERQRPDALQPQPGGLSLPAHADPAARISSNSSQLSRASSAVILRRA